MNEIKAYKNEGAISIFSQWFETHNTAHAKSKLRIALARLELKDLRIVTGHLVYA